MRRIDTPDGRFQAGDRTTRRPGTIVPSWFLNMLQEELISVVQAADVALDPAKQNQVLEAIKVIAGAAYKYATADKAGLIRLASTPLDADEADTAISPAQLAAVLAGLSTEAASETVAGVLKIATTALARGLTDDLTALTPKKLASAFGLRLDHTFTANDWAPLPGGLIVQWGAISAAPTVNYGSTLFPTTFNSAVLYCGAVDITSIGTNAVAIGVNPSRSGFDWQQGGANYVEAFNWLALGF